MTQTSHAYERAIVSPTGWGGNCSNPTATAEFGFRSRQSIAYIAVRHWSGASPSRSMTLLTLKTGSLENPIQTRELSSIN